MIDEINLNTSRFTKSPVSPTAAAAAAATTIAVMMEMKINQINQMAIINVLIEDMSGEIFVLVLSLFFVFKANRTSW
jgi:hypothetical protein